MTKARTPRRNAQQWQSLIDQWQKSGQSARQFCQEQALGYASFCQWRTRLSQASHVIKPDQRKSSEPSFIDLSSIGPTSPGNWQIVLSLGNGVELTLSQT